MMIRRISLSAALLVALSVAGCANGAGDSAGGPGANPSSEAPSAAPTSEAPSAIPTTEPSAGKPAETGSKTLSGTITAGVEPGCLLLEDHLLLIDDPALKSAAKEGATVTVTGRAEKGMMTTCQQGTPFVVTAIRAN
jgi:hypothetical protein